MEEIKRLRGKELRVQCKKEAKEVLKANKGAFILATLLYTILTMLISIGGEFIPVVGSLLSGVIMVLLSTGQLSMCLKALKGNKVTVNDMFDGFKVKPMITVGIFVLLTLLLVPVMIVGTILVFLVSGVSIGGSILAGSDVLSFTGLFVQLLLVAILVITVPTMILSAYFFLTFYFVVDEEVNDGVTVGGAIKMSFKLMKGHIWEYIVFSMSFMWWYLLVGVTLGLALLWVAPYSSLALTKYYEYIRDTRSSIE